MTKNLIVLHVSDVHFGLDETKGEQERIADALIKAVHSSGKIPDICVFSGDLTQDGTQLGEGEKWLAALMEPYDCPLFLVPGNHEVLRGSADHECLSLAFPHANSFKIQRDKICSKADHLSTFIKWHNDAAKRLNMKSDWSKNIFACLDTLTANGLTVRVICLNSAVLSHQNNEQRKLVIDTKSLNDLLGTCDTENELVLVVSHHPTDWLVEWNQLEIERLIRQKTGPHAYLHGHKHVPKGATESDITIGAICWLGAGAAYHDSEKNWEQSFSFYEFDLNAHKVVLDVYTFNERTGLWKPDTRLSDDIVARLPTLPGQTKPQKVAGPHGFPDRIFEEIGGGYFEPENVSSNLRQFDGISVIEEEWTVKSYRRVSSVSANRLTSSEYHDVLAQPCFILYSEKDSSTEKVDRLTVDSLTSPNLQRNFVRLSQHDQFLSDFEIANSYCFVAGEKTGKGSWLGFLGEHVLADLSKNYVPLWVNHFGKSDKPGEELVRALLDYCSANSDAEPVLLVDDLYRHPEGLDALARIKRGMLKDIPIYCTLLSEPPDGDVDRRSWENMKSRWSQLEDIIGPDFIIYDVPRHPQVVSGKKHINSDGDLLLGAVETALGNDASTRIRGELIEAGTVPLFFLSQFIQENFGRPPEDQQAWIDQRKADITPKALFRKTWEGSGRHHDVIRSAAFLEDATASLLSRYCARLRDEEEGIILDYIEEQIRLGRLLLYEQWNPFTDRKITTLRMVDGLKTTATDQENLPRPIRDRYIETLFDCVDPESEEGQLAALLSLLFLREDPGRKHLFQQKIEKQEWDRADCRYLLAVIESAFDLVAAPMQKQLASLAINQRPQRTRVAWSKLLASLTQNSGRELGGDWRTQLIAAAVATLEEEWKTGSDWEEAAQALVEIFVREKESQRALTWVRKLEDRNGKLDHRTTYLYVQCLSELKRYEAVSALLHAEDAPVDVLIGGANFHYGREEWDVALPLWQRIGAMSEEYRDAASGKALRCLLEIGDEPSIAEAKRMLEAEDAPVDALIEGANFYDGRKEWSEALPIHRRIGAMSEEHRDAALGNVQRCLLEIGDEPSIAEAKRMLEAEDAPVDVLIGGANFHHGREEWDVALPLWQRIGAMSEEYRDAASGKALRCLLEIGDEPSIAEAKRMLEAEDAPVDTLIEGAIFYDGRKEWSEALPLHRRVGAMSEEHGDAASCKALSCLLEIGDEPSIAEAKRMLEAEDATVFSYLVAIETYDRNGIPLEASKLQEQALERFPHDANLLIGCIKRDGAFKNWESVEILAKALIDSLSQARQKSEDLVFVRRLAFAYVALGNPEECLKLVLPIINKLSGNELVRARETVLFAACIQGDENLAVRTYNELKSLEWPHHNETDCVFNFLRNLTEISGNKLPALIELHLDECH